MDITRRLRGKTIGDVLCNGHILQIRTADGAEINIVWLDDNGKPLNGKPAVAQVGVRLIARGVQELVRPADLRAHG